MSYHLILTVDVTLEVEMIKAVINKKKEKHLPCGSRQLE